MKFSVTQVDILRSQTGEGLKVNDKTIACARITQIGSIEEGKSMIDLAKEGLCLGYKLNEDGTSLLMDEEDLKAASNYVLVVRDEPKEDGTLGDVEIVTSPTMITRLFELPDSDAEMLDKYLGALAKQRGLILSHYIDADTNEEAMFFTNEFDREINDAVLDNAIEEATQNYQRMLTNPDYRAEVQTDNFIRMFLVSVVETGQSRYNKLHRSDVIEKAAKLVGSISYWGEDGYLHKPTVKDINESIAEIADHIKLG